MKRPIKHYDRAYFDRWYRQTETRVTSDAELRRKVSLAVVVAEYFLSRPIRTVLDVGCGEGAWRKPLLALRPQVRYAGIDGSEYVVKRFGKSRNIVQGSFGDLPRMDLGVYDLVVCSDVLHYVPDEELRRGLGPLAEATDGVAYIEVLSSEDDITGDLQAFFHRPASWYRATFARAGLTPVAPYCWLSPAFRDTLAALESAGR